MKIAICLLVLLPLVYSAVIDKRLVLDTVGDLEHNEDLKALTSALQAALGSDVTLQACQIGCPAIAASINPVVGIAGVVLCPSACAELVKHG